MVTTWMAGTHHSGKRKKMELIQELSLDKKVVDFYRHCPDNGRHDWAHSGHICLVTIGNDYVYF